MDFQDYFPVWNKLNTVHQGQILGTLKITHEAVANHLGSHREVITRMLKYFQNEGMVKLSRGTIELTDKTKLEELSEI